MWAYVASAALSIVPALLLLVVFVRIDQRRPEPWRTTVMTFALGITASAPAAALQFAMHRALGDAALVGGRLIDAVVVFALTEELVKLAVVMLYSYRLSTFDEVMDGVLYAAVASLGFGLVENVLYAFYDVRTGLLRAISAVPMHAVATGLMGYWIGRAKFVSRVSAVGLIATGLGIAVFVHGLYDWVVFLHVDGWFALSCGVVASGGVVLALFIRHALRMDDAMLGRESVTAMLHENWPRDIPQSIVPNAPVRPPTAPTPGERK